MKILKDVDIAPIYMRPGSTLSVDWNGETILTQPIETEMVVDRAIVFEVQDQFGFKTGIGVVLGEKHVVS